MCVGPYICDVGGSGCMCVDHNYVMQEGHCMQHV